MRLDKLLSKSLGLTRSEAKRLLSRGEVTVNGRTARSGSEIVEPGAGEVRVGGRPVLFSEHVYLLVNKPLGVVSATEDPRCKTVLDLVPRELFRKGLFPVGRLDKYSEGMMILSDDGAFAHRVLSPRSHLPKTYEVTVDAPVVDGRLAEAFAQGVDLGFGESSSPALLEPLSRVSARVTIYEGIYHEVRRMFDRFGARVTTLRRVRIGGLPMDPALAPGQVRPLTAEELEILETGVDKKDARSAESL